MKLPHLEIVAFRACKRNFRTSLDAFGEVITECHTVLARTLLTARATSYAHKLPSGPCTKKAIVVDVDMTNRVVASEIVPCEATIKNTSPKSPE